MALFSVLLFMDNFISFFSIWKESQVEILIAPLIFLDFTGISRRFLLFSNLINQSNPYHTYGTFLQI